MIAVPSVSQADPITITSISVTVGGQTWCNTGGSCAADHQLWNLGAGGTTLQGGQSLILTQTTPTTPGYNFDTSDANSPGCGSPNPCSTSLSINGQAITLDGTGKDVLANSNVDPGTTTHNEATNWASASSTLATTVCPTADRRDRRTSGATTRRASLAVEPQASALGSRRAERTIARPASRARTASMPVQSSSTTRRRPYLSLQLSCWSRPWSSG